MEKELDNNDILKKSRYALDLKDTEMVDLFQLAGQEMSRSYLKLFFKKEEDEGYLPLTDELLFAFLDGLIIKKRGVREEK